MVTCPWCGTTYATFQTNCSNCGGALPAPVPQPDRATVQDNSPSDTWPNPYSLPTAPLPPRQVPENYVWRRLLADAGGIVGLVFTLIGSIFSLVGCGLIAAAATAPVGVIFAPLGGMFLIGGMGLLAWRYNAVAKTLYVLRDGQMVRGFWMRNVRIRMRCKVSMRAGRRWRGIVWGSFIRICIAT
jgi:hypothetical protein